MCNTLTAKNAKSAEPFYFNTHIYRLLTTLLIPDFKYFTSKFNNKPNFLLQIFKYVSV